MRFLKSTLAPLSVLLVAACATAGPASTTRLDDGRPRARAAGPRDPITAADIARIGAGSAYDAVRRLRSNALAIRGVNSVAHPVRASSPVVFVDGMEVGTVFELRSIPAIDVHEIRFLSASEATTRFGDGYMAGVIHVMTKR